MLFGAFDRHNLGDLLLAEVAAALLDDAADGPRGEAPAPCFAGLAARDLRPAGGRRCDALADLAHEQVAPALLWQVGGEVLTCTAWQAAVMLQPAATAQATIAYLEAHPAEQPGWVRAVLGTDARAPYAAARQLLPRAARVAYCAVGGVALAGSAPALRDEVIAELRAADALSVRDRVTQAALAAAGVHAPLMPDAATLVPALFGARLRRQLQTPALAALRAQCPNGWLALQFSAEFADDATLQVVAAQLDALAAATGLGLVFFCAGQATWHDDAQLYRRTMARLRWPRAHLFEATDLWALAALVLGSRGVCGRSRHGRILAMAGGLPRLNLLATPPAPGAWSKTQAYAQAWEPPDLPGAVVPTRLAAAMAQALAADPARLRRHADMLATRCRAGVADLRARLD